jgi:hypothetical protein
MTMQENLNQHFEKLPLHLRAEVLDFVLFLEQKYLRERPEKSPAEKLTEIPEGELNKGFEHYPWVSLETAYHEMAQDEEAEAEALEWSEALIGDVADEPR